MMTAQIHNMLERERGFKGRLAVPEIAVHANDLRDGAEGRSLKVAPSGTASRGRGGISGMDRLRTLDVFVQAAEARSFAAAGRAIGISPSAIGKSISRLEDRLGLRLFHRSTRSIALTAEGSRLLTRCARVFAELESAELEISQANSHPTGRLRVSLPMVGLQMSRALGGFVKAYPEIELDLDFSDRPLDLIEEGFDVMLRTGDVDDSRLMTRVIGQFSFEVVASPGYLVRNGTPARPDDLARHPCLHYRSPATGKIEQWPFVRSDQDTALDLPAVMTASAPDSLVAMAAQGLGLACLPDFVVARQIAAGHLRPVLSDFEKHRGTLRLLWPSSRYLSPKIKAFVTYMAACAARSDGFDKDVANDLAPAKTT